MTEAAPATSNPFSVIFGFRGRIGRAKYWIGFAVAFMVVLVGLGFAATAMNPTGGGAPILAIPLLLLFVWIYAAVTVKRLRDAGWPIWVGILWALAPAIWVFATLEFIEYIGFLIAFGVAVLFIVPGILPSKPPA